MAGTETAEQAALVQRRGLVSIFEIFARAERNERAVADLYRRMRERLDWAEDDLVLLRRLEEEEVQHAARIRLLAAHYRAEPRLFDVAALRLHKLEDMERQVGNIIREVEEGRFDHDLPGLKQRIVALEAACSAETEVMVGSADPAVARFFRALAQQDRAHGELLRPAT